MRWKHCLVALAIALLVPQPAWAQRGDWEVVPNVLLSFSARHWQIDSAANQLTHKRLRGCALAQNAGRGIPEDWTMRAERIARGTRRMVRTTYHDARGRVQFAVYRYTYPRNLGYLNEEGMLLAPPDDLRFWLACRRAAEQVLATARRVR
ncbi:MAG: hypothetical protein N2545_04135 [Thermoflexales bacterium]|nr:hypothetical protein [Thermoflexales bacterium]